MRAHLKDVPKAAVDLLLSVGDHQQLHADDACIYGVFADLVYRLEGLTDELGLLHFLTTEKLLVTGRREGLNSTEAVRVLEAVERNGTIFQVGVQGMSDDSYISARKVIEDGMLGQVLQAQIDYVRRYSANSGP